MTGKLTSRLLLMAVLTAPPAYAGSLLCGTRVVSEGMSSSEVAAACGGPTHIERSTAYRQVAVGAGSYPGITNTVTVEVHLESWLYNFGPDKLMQRLSLADGMVTRIESLGYGYVEPGF